MIRPFKIEDEEGLFEIFNLNTPTYFDPNEIGNFKAYLKQYGKSYFTIESESKIVGGAGYYINENDNSGRVCWIFFHPKYSGMGLGKKVMEHCLEALKANPIVEKLVVTTSQLAYKFFERFGYKLIHTIKEYWGAGLDLYLMVKPLTKEKDNTKFGSLDVQLDITKNLKNQFVRYFNLLEVQGEYYLDALIGGGKSMEFVDLPGQMEFYHFKKSHFKIPIHMKSINPKASEWFLIHINLSKTKQQKKVADDLLNFQKHLPIGLLLYGPGLEINTNLPPNVDMELASIHFHRSFLDTYFENWREHIDITKNLVYEDLDYQLENALYKALNTIRNKIECHANVLHFMNLFFKKIQAHSRSGQHIVLHTEDVKSLFLASSHLRNPLATKVPSLEELASISNMGITKFKTSFKQLFGSPPIQYRNKIRMEFAREEIVARRKTPTEISYTLGYTHPSNFTAAYKKFFGELPSARA